MILPEQEEVEPVETEGEEQEKQWLRLCSLIIADRHGEAMNLAGLRITFLLKKKTAEDPAQNTITIFNLSDETRKKLELKEFDRVILQAGYEGNYGTILTGNLISTRTVWTTEKSDREIGTSKTILTVADGDRAYNFSHIVKTLAAGQTVMDIVYECAWKMELEEGYMSTWEGTSLPRGKVMYGATRNFLRLATEAYNRAFTWYIQDGKLYILKDYEYVPGEATILAYDSGLISCSGEDGGFRTITCLLNPKIRVGSRIRLDMSTPPQSPQLPREWDDLSEEEREVQEEERQILLEKRKSNLDGYYVVNEIAYDGDTRGQNWYCNLVCQPWDETAQDA